MNFALGEGAGLNQNGADRAETSLCLFGRRPRAGIHGGEGARNEGKREEKQHKFSGTNTIRAKC